MKPNHSKARRGSREIRRKARQARREIRRREKGGEEKEKEGAKDFVVKSFLKYTYVGKLYAVHLHLPV